MNRVEYWSLSDVSTDISVAIFRANIYWLGVFWEPYFEQVESDERDVTPTHTDTHIYRQHNTIHLLTRGPSLHIDGQSENYLWRDQPGLGTTTY
jgi:hypothetical protein